MSVKTDIKAIIEYALPNATRYRTKFAEPGKSSYDLYKLDKLISLLDQAGYIAQELEQEEMEDNSYE